MKVLKNWLTSLACIAISAVSLGQTQNLKVYNYTSEPLYVQAWAVDDCNGTEQVSATYYLAAFTGVANIPVIFNTGTYPNAEWLVVRASDDPYGYWTGENTNLICTSFINYFSFFGSSTGTGSTSISGITWPTGSVAEVN